jgi:DNA-binding LytR/AlgR family response regulator
MLFRCAIELSVSNEYRAEVTFGTGRKGTDLPTKWPLHATCLFNKQLTLVRIFRLAHTGRYDLSTKSKQEDVFESTADDEFYEPVDTSLLPVASVDTASLIRVWQQLTVIAKRQAPRIAFKVKGRILFLKLAEIVAVQAEGNYVSLQLQPKPYLLHESLSSMAEKLKPYGFIRIHRSVVVNTSAVEEIQPLPTGEYRLRVKGGKEYVVTRTYKDNLRDLAQLWVGSDCLCG